MICNSKPATNTACVIATDHHRQSSAMRDESDAADFGICLLSLTGDKRRWPDGLRPPEEMGVWSANLAGDFAKSTGSGSQDAP
jgi:hypothetical protein